MIKIPDNYPRRGKFPKEVPPLSKEERKVQYALGTLRRYSIITLKLNSSGSLGPQVIIDVEGAASPEEAIAYYHSYLTPRTGFYPFAWAEEIVEDDND